MKPHDDAAAARKPGPAPMVRFDHVNKCFGEVEVLRDLCLDVGRGERIAIIGPSGSGKSTLLRLLMALERPTSGEVWVEGERMWYVPKGDRLIPASRRHLRAIRSKIGFVFQHFNLFPHMTALRNVTEAPRHVMGLERAKAEAQAKHLLELVGLGDKLTAYPSELSGGQQQRVAIARALAMDPEIMLFDEVTSALDPELVGEVLQAIRDLAERTSMTMLLVTHQMRFAQQFADEVAFFDGGVIVEKGSPDRIFSEPKEERTRAFLQAVLEGQ